MLVQQSRSLIEFTYLLQPNNRYTFQMPALRRYVANHCKRNILNLFAGKTRVHPNEFRVDLDPLVKPDYLGNAFDFLSETKLKFDTIIFDPPFNIRKAREKYNGRWIGKDTVLKDLLLNVMTDESVFISLGYNTMGMSKKRGFEKVAICLINHGGCENDTICLIEKRIKNLFGIIPGPGTGKYIKKNDKVYV